MTDSNDQPQKPYHSKSEMRRIEHMKEHAQKVDAPPREFWIVDFNGYEATINGPAYLLSAGPPNDPNEPFIHVIEKSAFDELVIKCARWKEIAQDNGNDALAKELAELKRGADRLYNQVCHDAEAHGTWADENLKLREELEAAKTRIAELEQTLKYRDEDIPILRATIAKERQEIERLQHVINYDMPHPQLTQANVEIVAWKNDWNISDQSLIQANARIKELEERLKPSANKYYFDQMHKYWDENIAFKEREQKFVAALEDAIGMINSEYCSHKQPCSSSLDTCYVSDFLKLLEAHKGGA